MISSLQDDRAHSEAGTRPWDVPAPRDPLFADAVERNNSHVRALRSRDVSDAKWHYTMPEPWSLRVLFLTIHVMLLVIFVAYTAQFISFLANRTPVLPFSTFEDLLTDRTYSLGVIKNSAREAFFKVSIRLSSSSLTSRPRPFGLFRPKTDPAISSWDDRAHSEAGTRPWDVPAPRDPLFADAVERNNSHVRALRSRDVSDAKWHYTMPEPWSLRVLFLTIHVMLLVIFVAYTAQFISFLANRTPVLPFSTFEDLLTDRTYSLGVIKNSAREAFFKNSVDPVLRGIFKKLIAPVQRRPNNDEDGLRILCADPQHGYFCSQISVRSLALKLPCSVAEIPEAYYSVSLAMTISKNSPYRRLLSYNLREMKRTGILKRIEMLHWPKFADKLDYGAPSVSFGTVIIFYYLLLGGMLAAVAILIIEHIVRHLRRRTRRDAPKSISSILASEKRRQLKAKAVFPYGLNMDKVN
ncbi:hypothetical protein C0J52_11675 [Blattella germanica]|nr:hypothetical protein C0J52_11675 [Blattella germanica]